MDRLLRTEEVACKKFFLPLVICGKLINRKTINLCYISISVIFSIDRSAINNFIIGGVPVYVFV